jgi:hypothetical protein
MVSRMGPRYSLFLTEYPRAYIRKEKPTHDGAVVAKFYYQLDSSEDLQTHYVLFLHPPETSVGFYFCLEGCADSLAAALESRDSVAGHYEFDCDKLRSDLLRRDSLPRIATMTSVTFKV